MRVGVFGLWHLGSVTAGCVAKHFQVVAVDPDPQVAAGFSSGKLPVDEPGLKELIGEGVGSGRLSFGSDVGVFSHCDVVWVAFDTPVNEDDEADTAYVEGQVRRLFPVVRAGSVILISSQLPAGTTFRLAAECAKERGSQTVSFAVSPENLRLGRAVEVFSHPDRIVAGVSDDATQRVLSALFAPFGTVVWMRVESAEMTKHAINCFLAMSIAFMNEIAGLCAATGADAREVERGLKTEARIGPHSYLSAGPAFGGGTLARDQAFLMSLAGNAGLPADVIRSIRDSNDRHKNWLFRTIEHFLHSLRSRRVTLLGLTYKPGTNTLRRSGAVELARALIDEGAEVTAFDPAIRTAVPELPSGVTLTASVEEATCTAEAVVVCTRWPEFLAMNPESFGPLRSLLIVDPFRFLPEAVQRRPATTYVAVGFATNAEVTP